MFPILKQVDQLDTTNLKLWSTPKAKGGNLMIDKGLNPIRKGIIKDPTFSVYKKGGSVDKPEQLELPLDNPNDNILNFPIKPEMHIKSNAKQTGQPRDSFPGGIAS